MNAISYCLSWSYRYAIGLYNRKRKRLDVYETESNGIIFNLGITSVTNRDGTTTYDNNDLTEVSAKARRDMLIESFGSRKKKAMERSKAANIVDVAAVAAAEQVAATLRESSTTLSSTNSTDGTTTTTTRPTSTSERKVTEALNIARRAMLPPYNELASIPDDVYPFDGIITNEEVDTIQYTTNNILRAISTKDKTALEQLAMVHARGSEYVRDRLFRLSENDDSNKHKSKKHHDDDTFNDKSVLRKRVRALLYLKCLLALHRAPNELRPRTLTNNTTTEGDGTENNDNTNTLTDPAINNITQEGIPQLRWIPAPIQTRMLSLFTEQRVNTRSNSSSSTTSTSNDTIYVRTPDLIDKLITWIACLSLIIDGYTTDLRLLATDMRLPPVRLLHFYKELGCNATPIRSNVPGNTVDEDNEEDNDKTSSGRSTVISYTVALHVPLNFPKPKIGRARG